MQSLKQLFFNSAQNLICRDIICLHVVEQNFIVFFSLLRLDSCKLFFQLLEFCLFFLDLLRKCCDFCR